MDFFNSGLTIADLRASGNNPLDRDRFTICTNIGKISGRISIRNLVGMRSRLQVALEAFIKILLLLIYY